MGQCQLGLKMGGRSRPSLAVLPCDDCSVAHRLSTVVDSDRIVVVDGGRLAESGSDAELLRRGGLYADMWARKQAEREAGEAIAAE